MSTKDLINTNQAACEFYQTSLYKNKKALEYVQARIPDETIRKFKIGYGAASGLIEHLVRNKLKLKWAEELGILDTDLDDIPYHIFTGRIMIPIIYAGAVVGFGGRALKAHTAKYINSKTSAIYEKKSILFGMDLTRKYIYKKDCAILVEGYFDVFSLYSHGIKNVAAVCGSAFTSEQAKLLSRYTDSVVVMFDGDDAGIAAAKKAKKVLKKYGMFKGNIEIPHKMDPDSFLQKYGRKGLKSLKVTGK